MWWYLVKIIDNDSHVVYSYGRETRLQSGELEYNRKTDEITIKKMADNDTQNSVERFLHHFYRIVTKENCPMERTVAIG